VITEWISKGVDKLPRWARVTVYVLLVIATVYGIARYGFWHIVLRAIFSP
jgi:hypothetical protein